MAKQTTDQDRERDKALAARCLAVTEALESTLSIQGDAEDVEDAIVFDRSGYVNVRVDVAERLLALLRSR